MHGQADVSAQVRGTELGSRHRLPTLRELLRREHFQSAEVIAGRDFLDVPVRWVHVGEIPDIATYLRGQELVLSTGVGLRQRKDRLAYLERLARSRIAGVCIERGRYLRRVPDDMVHLADRLGLPLIIFHEPVRFVDITQDVHGLILQGTQGMLEALQKLSDELGGLQTEADADQDQEIVARLGSWLERPVVFVPEEGRPLHGGAASFQASALEAKARELQRTMAPTRSIYPEVPLPDGGFMISRLVRDGAAVFGLVASICESDDRVAIGMALDLAAAALARDIGHRSRAMEEGAHLRSRALVKGLLSGVRMSARLLEDELRRLGLGGPMPVQAMLMLLRPSEPVEEGRASAKLQEWLRAQQLRTVTTPLDGNLAALVFDPPPLSSLRAIVHRLRDARPIENGSLRWQIGISRRAALHELSSSLREAELALAVNLVRGERSSPFYQELGALRILLNLRDDFDLTAFVEDEIGPLLEHDRHHGADLVRTLAALLSSDRKDEVARHLGIHRQTLYYRIERIQQWLGDDFMSPRRRPSLQLALLALEITSTGRPDPVSNP